MCLFSSRSTMMSLSTRLICVLLLVFQMQQQELAQIRQREANQTALAAIGPRKKRRMDSPVRGANAEVGNVEPFATGNLLAFWMISDSLNTSIKSFLSPSRAQGQAPPILEAPVERAPDSSCDSASLESTSGTCCLVWRMKARPVTHTCSIKASSNSTCITCLFLLSGIKEAELTISSDPFCQYFLWSPAAERWDVCLWEENFVAYWRDVSF